MNAFWTALYLAFARTIVSDTKLPDTPAAPEHSTDSTGVITGNADLVSERDVWDGPQERPTLPGTEHLQGWGVAA